MIKKILTTIALSLVMVPVLCAQQWVQHPSFSGGVSTTNVIDTEQRVYFLVNKCLYVYDKTSGEIEFLNSNNVLHDINIKQIYYNDARQYVAVVYMNSNIDIIDATGAVHNVPAIKDVVMNDSRLINDVTFSTGCMWVATDFGFVLFDEDNFTYRQMRNYATAVTSVARTGNLLTLSIADKLYRTAADAPAEVFGELAPVTGTAYPAACLYPVNDSCMIVSTTGGLHRANITRGDEPTYAFTKLFTASGLTPSPVQRTPSGFLVNYFSKSYYYTLDAAGATPKKVGGGKEMYSACPQGDGTLWAVGANGLHIKGKTSAEDYHKPNAIDFASVSPFWLSYNKLSHKIYVCNSGPMYGSSGHETRINTFDGKSWENVTPSNLQKGGLYGCIFHPTDTATFFAPSWYDGLYRIKGKTKVDAYNYGTNSPMIKASGICGLRAAFDDYGNLWMVQSASAATKPVAVLPAAKLDADPLVKADWYNYNVEGTIGISPQRAIFAISRGTNVKVYCGADWLRPVVFWDEEGDLSNTSPKSKSYTYFVDENGNVVDWTYIYRFKAAPDGRVWGAFNEGLMSFDPAEAFGDDFRIMNSTALQGNITRTIEFGPQGQVWVGTDEMGVCEITSDGTQIINQYTTSNSPMVSNHVYDLCYNEHTHSLFITTDGGVMEMKLDGASGSGNYDNVYAHPNPVVPDYTGYVSISGLMDASNVVIKDRDGHVVARLTAPLGTATWDGCDATGERVPTGYYRVFASQADIDDDAAPVTTIRIIK